jgi:hypothetical protein
MAEQNCYKGIIDYVNSLQRQSMAYHNMTQHNGKQDMRYFHNEVSKSREKLEKACNMIIDEVMHEP